MSSRTDTATVPSPLRSARLRRIVAAYTVNRLGTWFGFIALAVAVYDHTHSAVAVSALLLAGQVLPAFVVPALVVRVEASSRRGELSGLYLLEAAATAALAALVWRQFWLPGILLLVALDGTAALAASALLRAAAARAAREWAHDHHARSAPVPESLPAQTFAGQVGVALVAGEQGIEDDAGPNVSDAREASAQEAERRANAAINIGFAITFTLGPALAGLVVPAYGAPAALLIDTASFVICAAMLLDLRPYVEDGETSLGARTAARSAGSTSATRPRCAAYCWPRPWRSCSSSFPRRSRSSTPRCPCTRATAATASCWAYGASASRSAAPCSRARSNARSACC